jgi:hypothetical protein
MKPDSGNSNKIHKYLVSHCIDDCSPYSDMLFGYSRKSLEIEKIIGSTDISDFESLITT